MLTDTSSCLECFFNTGDFKSSLLLSELCRARALRDRLSIKYLKLQEMKGEERIPFIDKDFVISTNTYSILFYSVYFDEVFAYLIENGEIKYVFSKALENFSGDSNKLTRKVFDEMQVSEVSNCENRSMDKEDEMRTTEADELLFFRLTLPKPKEKSNGTLLEGFRGNSPETKESYSYNCSLEELFMKLFGHEKHLITRDDIVIISDGPLQRVPFAALRDPDTGRYLSETMRIRLAPSLSFLKLINECPDDYHCKTGKLIIGDPLVGNVMFDGKETEFRPLENAFCEAHAVGSALHATPLTKENATKAAVIEKLQQGVSVIHIAAHGSLTKGRIALAPSPEIRATKIPDEEDYMLTMADVQKAQVRAQLVVLSCCHSGHGEIRAEGVVGMCRAFLASGARAVVASLWAIDDEATLEFMTRFYQNISERKLSASASLQQAMKEMRNTVRYNEPKYWAPFFLIGDDVTIKF